MQSDVPIRRLGGANLDIDLATPPDRIPWNQDPCPWNQAESTDRHRCAVKNVSICPFFCGVEYLDYVLCCYPQENPLRDSASKTTMLPSESMDEFAIRPVVPADRSWVESVLTERWGATQVVSKGHLHQASDLPGFIATRHGNPVGLLTFAIYDQEYEVVSLDSLLERKGVGTRLVAAAVDEAKRRHLRRVWLITTNDNLDALRFYQRRGFHLKAVHPGALEASRKLKPQIPLIGERGIPLRDEIELELII